MTFLRLIREYGVLYIRYFLRTGVTQPVDRKVIGANPALHGPIVRTSKNPFNMCTIKDGLIDSFLVYLCRRKYEFIALKIS